MADRFYLILEILAVLLCLHGLYGEKFKWNIYTVLFIAVEFIAYQIEDVYAPVKHWEIFLYALLFLYSKIQFKCNWKESMINYVLCIVLSAVMQMICYFPVMILYSSLFDFISFSVNSLLLLLAFLVYKNKILSKVSLYMQQKGKAAIALLITVILFIIFQMYKLRVFKSLDILDYLVLIVGIVFLLILLLELQKERFYNKQMKAEVSLNKLYGKALTELIDKVRVNQHNYKNQLAAIQGMIYTAGSLEELKKEQNIYYNRTLQEDEYAQIISGNNDPVIAGFLYSKLCSFDLNNICITSFLHISKINDSLFTADIIKIFGVLIDNAIEEISKDEYEKKNIEIKAYQDEENFLYLEVGNICRYIKRSEIVEFFKKGTSSKGKDRGLGLYSVKTLVKKWKGEIIADNIEKENENWLYIIVKIYNK